MVQAAGGSGRGPEEAIRDAGRRNQSRDGLQTHITACDRVAVAPTHWSLRQISEASLVRKIWTRLPWRKDEIV